ncbi:hypothetical protein CTEN210_01614 [Chaetoceros tenuissimus]|uniref:Uncharacterized protein n=1 Tax=Chaetoceros tenuissimus TaxID=426638 RepID=A0AAD3GZU4_9STRA|nr:hypothetical protein CTEN210_01614 [Chaetoceros tenuissimus]
MNHGTKQRLLLLLLTIGFLPGDVEAFSSYNFPSLATSPSRSTLYAISSAESYLNTLTQIMDKPANFATSEYLNTLSPTPEEFLINLSTQLNEASATVHTSSFLDAVQGASAILADSDLDLKSQLGSMSYDFSISAEADLNPKQNKFSFGGGKSLFGNKVDKIAETTSNTATSISDKLPAMPKIDEVPLNTQIAENVAPSPIEPVTSILADSTTSSSTVSKFGTNAASTINDATNSASSVVNNIGETLTQDAGKITSEGTQIAKELTESATSKMYNLEHSVADKVTTESAQLAKGLSDSTSNAFKSIEDSFSAGASNVANGGTTFVKGLGKATSKTFNNIGSSIQNVESNLVKSTGSFGKAIAESSDSTVQALANTSLEDVGKSAISSIKYMGSVLEQVLNVILGTFANTSVHNLIESAQKSMDTMIHDATQSVTKTITEMGDITLRQVVQGLASLVVTVSKMLVIVINAVVKLVSGKDAGEWVLAASNSVTQQANELSSKAANAAYDFTHATFKELTLSMSDFSHHVGNEMLASVGTLNDAGLNEAITTALLP